MANIGKVLIELPSIRDESAESMMARNEFDVTSAQVLALIEKSNCSSYDCEFIALAQYLNVQFVTQNKKILQEFPSITIPVVDFIGQKI